MRFNPRALVLFVSVCLFVVLATSSGSAWVSAAEAVTSVVILLSLFGLLRGRRQAG